MKWRCASCGKPHRKKNPPCDNCGHMKLEEAVVPVQDDAPDEEPIDIEWRCAECDHKHVKNAPPCNQCGNMRFEKKEIYPSDRQNTGDSITPSRRGLVKYGAAGVLVLLGGGYALADGASEPTIEDAPGKANFANGLNFQETESQMLDRINTERRNDGLSGLDDNEDLKQMAEYHSKDMVTNDYYSADSPDVDLFAEFSNPCNGGHTLANRITNSPGRAIEFYDSEDELASALVTSWLDDSNTRDALLRRTFSRAGTDIHVDTNGDIYVTTILC